MIDSIFKGHANQTSSKKEKRKSNLRVTNGLSGRLKDLVNDVHHSCGGMMVLEIYVVFFLNIHIFL